jgi:hypothetical protein
VPLRRHEQFGKPVAGVIPTIVRSYKSAVTRLINAHRGTPGARVWQRNYHACPERQRRERIIRNEIDLSRIRKYIEYNPVCWVEDVEYRHGEIQHPYPQ